MSYKDFDDQRHCRQYVQDSKTSPRVLRRASVEYFRSWRISSSEMVFLAVTLSSAISPKLMFPFPLFGSFIPEQSDLRLATFTAHNTHQYTLPSIRARAQRCCNPPHGLRVHSASGNIFKLSDRVFCSFLHSSRSLSISTFSGEWYLIRKGHLKARRALQRRIIVFFFLTCSSGILNY